MIRSLLDRKRERKAIELAEEERKRQLKIIKLAEEDIRRVISILKGYSDYEMGAVVISSALAFNKLYEAGLLTYGLFDTPNPNESSQFIAAMSTLGDVIRAYQLKGQKELSAAFVSWHQSLRAICYPEITYLGKKMWEELKRGFPHANTHYKEMCANLNVAFKPLSPEEIEFIPTALDEDNASGGG